MKYLITVFIVFSSFLVKAQQLEYEIFYWNVEYRDSIGGNFKNEEFSYVVAMVTLSDTAISIRGSFSNWKSKEWKLFGKATNIPKEKFMQTIIAGFDPKSNEFLMISFLKGPFKYPEWNGLPETAEKFELTFLYRKKRYIFIGLLN